MNKNFTETHTRETFYYAASMFLDRASYYGIRAIALIYMTSESLKMEKADALSVFGWFCVGLFVFKIAGAIIGDLLIGNRRSIILGLLIQALGAFCFFIPSTSGVYFGLGLLLIGEGLYYPNLSANFAKLYLNKIKLLDSGMALLYFGINIGAFLGIIVIGMVGETYGWRMGFLLAGIWALLSLIPILFSQNETSKLPCATKLSFNRRIVNILIAFVSIGIFWALFGFSKIRIFELEEKFCEMSNLFISKSFFKSLSSYFLMILSLLAFVFWTYVYTSQFFKLILGFVFAACSFGILYFLPDLPKPQHAFLYTSSVFLFALAEIHVAPIIVSILVKYGKPKYFAILISLIAIPIQSLSFLVVCFGEIFPSNPTLAIPTGFIGMSIFALVLYFYHKTIENIVQ